MSSVLADIDRPNFGLIYEPANLLLCRGAVRFHHLDPWESGGVDFEGVFAGLSKIGYAGYFAIHQAQGITTTSEAIRFATRCAEFVRS